MQAEAISVAGVGIRDVALIIVFLSAGQSAEGAVAVDAEQVASTIPHAIHHRCACFHE